MKAGDYNFLAKANIRGSKRSNSVFALLLLSVFALLLVTSFSFTLSQVMNNFKNQDPARRLGMDSSFVDLGQKKLTQKLIEEIRNQEHVQSVDINDGMMYQDFKIKTVSDGINECKNIFLTPIEKCSVTAWSLYKSQSMDVVAGKKLDESPVFSCLVPSSFCPDNNYDSEKNNGTFQKGEEFVGKTFTVEAFSGEYESIYYREIDLMTDWYRLPAVEYKLKVVGVFNASYDGDGIPNYIYISNETGQKMQEMAVNATDDKDFIQEYQANLKKPELHSYTVLVDKAENVEQVRKQLQSMDVSVWPMTEKVVPQSIGLFATVFTAAGNFFTVAVLLLTIINLFLSTSNSLLERKGEIGLLKAVGYKNRQIFMSLYMEQMILGLRAFLIGGGISAAAVAVLNIINANGPFVNRIYVVKWPVFLLLAAAALFVTIAVPLICQLVLIRSMTKIEPREAMAAQ